MNVKIDPSVLSGTASPPSSKSDIHRRLIAAALLGGGTVRMSGEISDDVRATADCLMAMGAGVAISADAIAVRPIVREAPHSRCSHHSRSPRVLDCGESGSTLRFLLPVCAALGGDWEFRLHGRLPERPLSPLDGELRRHGATLELHESTLRLDGKLDSGDFTIDGGVSSQFITGLLFASIITGSAVRVTGKIESRPYIGMTLAALADAGARVSESGGVYRITDITETALDRRAEGDWSGAAFLVCAGALSPAGVSVIGVDAESTQGDSRILDIVRSMGAEVSLADGKVTVRGGNLRAITLDASDVPDLVPAVAAASALAEGDTVIRGAARLRLKESDRIRAVSEMINSLGGECIETDDGMVIRGRRKIAGGECDSFGDHRIAMAAAILAASSEGGAIIRGAECVSKSFPNFFECIEALGAVVTRSNSSSEAVK